MIVGVGDGVSIRGETNLGVLAEWSGNVIVHVGENGTITGASNHGSGEWNGDVIISPAAGGSIQGGQNVGDSNLSGSFMLGIDGGKTFTGADNGGGQTFNGDLIIGAGGVEIRADRHEPGRRLCQRQHHLCD